MLYRNPIIPGYSPDPSICRVGEDFYLVNSTFEFFPGVPIYHSKNLVNWELINYCLTRPSQLYLEGCRNSGGIYAPTIRYQDGMFYMITTNVTDKGNFVVHTKDIYGNWSEPAWIDQGGIDPSLFWDEDGICYYCSTGVLDGVRGIVAFRIDPISGEILSEKHLISQGCGGQCAEGPHIYKRNGWYYLMLAEGGTEYGHRETIQRAKEVFGPYQPAPLNPILTHMEYKKSEIHATGHADLVEDQNGRTWAVFLGIRKFGHPLLHNLGRETFLAPVTWDKEGWPIIGNGGRVELVMDEALPAKTEPVDHSRWFDFGVAPLGRELFYTRNPIEEHYRLDTEKKELMLIGTKVSINEAGASPTILNLRQPDFDTAVTVWIRAEVCTAKRCGISAYYNNDYHYDLYLGKENGETYIGFYKHIHDFGMEITRISIQEEGTLQLQIRTNREGYWFFYKKEGEIEFTRIGFGHIAGLCTEGTMSMTFTGTLFSLFCEDGIGVFEKGFEMKVAKDVIEDKENGQN